MKVKIKKIITKDNILEKISEYDIYRYYFGKFTINKITNNNLRKETKPSFIIGNKLGGLSHKDFGDMYWRGNCFNLVEQIYYCDYQTALKIIDRDFGLQLFDSSPIKTEQIIQWKEPVISTRVKSPLIQIITKNYNKKELDYWEDYYQGLDDLKAENIFVPKKIFIDGQRKEFYEKELTFWYFSPEINKWKIYCPNSPETSFFKDGKKTIINKKWYSNIPFDYIEHIDKLNNCDTAFIAKSKKDKLVLQKALNTDCIVITQAEDPSCFSDENIKKILNQSKQQVVVYDSDKKGKSSSLFLTNNYGFKHCNPPDKYLSKKISDFADLANTYGLKKVTDHFKTKGWI